jgi:hypothetical protein
MKSKSIGVNMLVVALNRVNVKQPVNLLSCLTNKQTDRQTDRQTDSEQNEHVRKRDSRPFGPLDDSLCLSVDNT